MITFSSTFSPEDVSQLMKDKQQNIDATQPLSERSKQILRSVQFSSQDLKNAASSIAASKLVNAE